MRTIYYVVFALIVILVLTGCELPDSNKKQIEFLQEAVTTCAARQSKLLTIDDGIFSSTFSCADGFTYRRSK